MDVAEVELLPQPSKPQTTETSLRNDADPSKLKLTIAMRDVDVAVKVPINNNPLPTIFTPISNTIDSIAAICKKQPSTKDFYRLKQVSSYFEPGQLTLVLSPPGHGRSSFCRVVQSSLALTGGQVYYNGLSQKQCAKHNIDLTKLVQYQEQTDLHIAELTTSETIQFAMQMGSISYSEERVTQLLDELGILECKDVVVGNATLRGISGGQRRRLTAGVALSSDANVMVLDSPTDGLDSAVAEKIIHYLKNWCVTNQTQCIITLQQPTPQIYDLFDHLVLLREGEVVYDGPKEDVLPVIAAMGFQISQDVDVCDFLIDVLSQPRIVLQTIKINQIREERLAERERAKLAKLNKSADSQPRKSRGNSIRSRRTITEGLKSEQFNTTLGPLRPSPAPCITTEEMVEYYRTTPHWKKLNDNIDNLIRPYNPDHVLALNASHDTSQPASEESSQRPTSIPISDQPSHQNRLSRPTEPVTLPNGAVIPSAFANTSFQQRYSTGYRQSIPSMLHYVIKRQLKLQLRAKAALISRVFNTFIMGFIYAAIYYNIPLDDYRMRVASILLSYSQVIYNNMMDLASVNSLKPLIKQQMGQSMYPSWIWIVAYSLVSLPYILMEVTVFVLIFYFMESYTLNAASFFVYWVIFLFVSLCATFWFRFLAIVAHDYPTAAVLAAPTASYFLIFSGFYITRSNIQDWLIWYYWLSPFSWLMRANAVNEFRMSRYDELIPNAYNPGEMVRKGTMYLEYMDIYTDNLWILYGILYGIGFCFALIILSSLALKIKPAELSRGTRRVADLGNDVEELNELLQNPEQVEAHTKAMKQLNANIINNQQYFANQEAVKAENHVELVNSPDLPTTDQHKNNNDHNLSNDLGDTPSKTQQTSKISTQGHSGISDSSHINLTQLSTMNKSMSNKNALRTLTEKLPFAPTIVSFSNIRYTVPVINALDGSVSQKVLLDNVNGVAANGFVTYLMGASGAGKTTLLDVLAGRKTTGTIEGTILFNGVVPTKSQQHSLIGFVEQFDSLFAFASVDETLQYAADLRLPPTIDNSIKKQVVEEILQILDLVPLRRYIVENLSPSQRKLVSIGLELVSNPPVLYLDEPTTGLDSKSAQTVMRAVKRVAHSGRTVILTIHQPSAELSYFADSLCLLGPGGHCGFFGDVGFRFQSLIRYWETIPGVSPLPLRINVTSWLLEESSKIPDPKYVSVDYIQRHTTLLNTDKRLSPMNSLARIPSDMPDEDDDDVFEDLEGKIMDKDVTKIVQPISVEQWESLRPNQQWVLYLKWHFFAKSQQWQHTKTKLAKIERIYSTALGLAPPVEGVELVGGETGNVHVANTNQELGAIAEKTEVSPECRTDNVQVVAEQANLTAQTTGPRSSISHSNVQGKPIEDGKMCEQDQLNLLGSLQEVTHPTMLKQLYIFIGRQNYCYYRNPHAIINRTMVTIVTGVLAGLIYFRLNVNNASTLVSMLSAIVMCAATTSANVASGASSYYFATRPLLYREVDSAYYSTKFVWSFGVFCTEVIWAFPFAIISTIASFFLIGLYRSESVSEGIGAEHYFQYLLGVYLVMLIFLSTQSFFTAISRLPSMQQLLNSVVFGCYFALGGFAAPYKRLSSISGFHQFLYWIAPLGSLNFFFNCVFFGNTDKTIEIIQNDQLVEVSLKDYAAEYFGFHYDLKWMYWGLLLVHIFVLQVLYNLSMVFINHNKR